MQQAKTTKDRNQLLLCFTGVSGVGCSHTYLLAFSKDGDPIDETAAAGVSGGLDEDAGAEGKDLSLEVEALVSQPSALQFPLGSCRLGFVCSAEATSQHQQSHGEWVAGED